MPLENKPTAASQNVEDPREKAMIEAFIQGDTAGFKFVYTKYRQRVLSYCLYYMGSQASAEDAFQEVFSRAYTRRDQLRETKALKSWLLLITRSVCLNMLRTSKFTPDFVSISNRDDSSESYREPKELSVQPVEQYLADDMLKSVLSKLAPIYRDAFLLREFEGYDYEEIAEITETSVMNVKVRITRAKKRLRILLAPHYAQQNGSRRTIARTDEEDLSPEPNEGSAEEVYAL